MSHLKYHPSHSGWQERFDHFLTEIHLLLEQFSDDEIIDIISFLRIKYSKKLIDISNEKHDIMVDKCQDIPESPGVYLIFTINPEANVILYAGQTKASKTGGLRSRVRAHIRISGKTPFNVFIPVWWVKKIYTIPLSDQEDFTMLEDRLWTIIDELALNDMKYTTIAELEDKIILKLLEFNEKIPKINIVDFQPELYPKYHFLVKKPPVGKGRW